MAPSKNKDKRKETADDTGGGTLLSCVIGAMVWTFLSSDPSPTAWIIATLFLAYAVLAYCLLELYLMEEAAGGHPVKVRGQQASPLQLDIYDA